MSKIFFIISIFVLNVISCTPLPKDRIDRASLMGDTKTCLKNLSFKEIDYIKIPDKTEKRSCSIKDAVKVFSVGKTKLSRGTVLTCRMAEKLLTFEQIFLQPAAKKIFNQKIKTIHHRGSYNCRTIRNNRKTLSEHAFANAIDISGFSLEDGTKISLIKDWKKHTKKSEFLMQIAQGACTVFSVTLTPDSNAAHKDHFHFDAGYYKLCDIKL